MKILHDPNQAHIFLVLDFVTGSVVCQYINGKFKHLRYSLNLTVEIIVIPLIQTGSHYDKNTEFHMCT